MDGGAVLILSSGIAFFSSLIPALAEDGIQGPPRTVGGADDEISPWLGFRGF